MRRVNRRKKTVGRWLRFEVQEKTETETALGDYSHVWARVFYMRGAIKQISGEEKLRAMATQVDSTHRVYCRWDSRLTELLRLKRGTAIYNIKSADNLNEENKEMILTVVKGIE